MAQRKTFLRQSLSKYFGDMRPGYFREIGVNKKRIEKFYINLFNVVNENIELYRILLTDQSSAGYLQTALAKLRKEMESITKPDPQNKIKLSFLLNGILGTIGSYIKFASGTTEENIKILTDLTLSNLRHISYSR